MSFRRVLAATALVSTVFLGCAETDSIEDLEEPTVTPKTGGGAQSGGTNGGSSNDNHALEGVVLAATNSPLVLPGTMKVHPDISANLLAQPGGTGIFKYAVQCALDKHVGSGYVTSGLKKFYGLGHLRSTDGWLAGPLDAEARNDLFACIATLMNPFGAHVDIVIEDDGGAVRDDGLDHSEFDFKEAAWAAEVIGSTVYYTVWPTEELIENCNGDPIHVFETRVCGNLPGVCHFAPGGTFEDDCQPQPTGGILCDGKEVLVTYLRYADFLTLNPACE